MSCSKQCIAVNTLVLSCWGLKIPIFYPVLQIFKTILYAPLSPYPPHVLLLHRLPVESALIAQTSIFARFHWYVSVLKFRLWKSPELLELCLFIMSAFCGILQAYFDHLSQASLFWLKETIKPQMIFLQKPHGVCAVCLEIVIVIFCRILLHAIAVYWYLQVIALKGKRSSFFLFSSL